MFEFISDLEVDTDIIRTYLKGDQHRLRMFLSSLQLPCYNNFSHYCFQDILSCLLRKLLIHEQMIEELKQLQVEDVQQSMAKTKENELEMRLDEI